MQEELYACSKDSNIKKEHYLVLMVEKKADDISVYLDISGQRGKPLDSKNYDFYSKGEKDGEWIPCDINEVNPDSEYEDGYYSER